MAPAIFMPLSGEAREAVSNMDIDALTAKTGIKNLLVELDKTYLNNESSIAYEAYETFEKIMRPDMRISDNVIKFQ